MILRSVIEKDRNKYQQNRKQAAQRKPRKRNIKIHKGRMLVRKKKKSRQHIVTVNEISTFCPSLLFLK